MFLITKKNINFYLGIIVSLIIATIYSFQIIANVGLYNDLEFYFNSYLICKEESIQDCILWLIEISGKVEPGIAVIYKFIEILNIESETAFILSLFYLMNLISLLYIAGFNNHSSDEKKPALLFTFLFSICLLNFYYFTITTYFVRQVYSILIFLLATQMRSKIIKLLLVLASLLFHYSSVILIFGYIGAVMVRKITQGKSVLLLFMVCTMVALIGFSLQKNFGFLAINSTIDPYLGSDNASSAIHTLQQYIISFIILLYLQIYLDKDDINKLILNITMLFFSMFSIINFYNVHAAYRLFIPVGLYCSLLPLMHYRYIKKSLILISIYLLLILINLRLSYRYFIGEYVPS